MWDMTAGVLVVAPILVLGLQSYGGEARSRVYLFTLPWLSFLAASLGLGSVRRRAALRPRLTLVLTTGAVSTCLLFAYFGLELANVVKPSDLAAPTWFERHVRAQSLAVQVAPNNPTRLTERYPVANDLSYTTSPALIETPAYRNRHLDGRDLPKIERSLRQFGTRRTYMVLAGSQERYANLYGVLQPGWRASLEQALATSRKFRRVFRSRDASVFQYLRRR